MPELQRTGGDATICTYCARIAVGPCASCEAPVCGECCTLTEGGVRVWAICLECDLKAGRSLRARWTGLVTWLLLLLLALAAIVALLTWLGGRLS